MSVLSRHNYATFIKEKSTILLLVLIFIAVFVRFTTLSVYKAQPQEVQQSSSYISDSLEYAQFAQIFSEHGFQGIVSKNFEKYQYLRNNTPTTVHYTPLYPLFLAGIFSFSTNPLPVLYTQILIDAGTILLIFFCVKLIYKKDSVALGAALLFALNPIAIIYCLAITPETFFTFLLIATIYSALIVFQKPSYKGYAAMGFLLGITTLTKPVALYFSLVIIIFACVGIYLFRHKIKSGISMVVVFVLVFLLTISPWQIRNLYVYGHYSLTMQQGRELLVAMVGGCRVWNENTTKAQITSTIEKPYLSISDPFIRSQKEQEAAINYINKHKLQYLWCQKRGMIHFFKAEDIFVSQSIFTPATNLFFQEYLSNSSKNDLSSLFTLAMSSFYLLSICGLFLIRKNKHILYSSLFIGSIILYIAILSGVEGYVRYLAPVTPYIIILSVIGFYEVYKLLKDRIQDLYKKVFSHL
jgi:4-amino-4-deoxy-L-arabinose transferase-like glycosyltransferase